MTRPHLLKKSRVLVVFLISNLLLILIPLFLLIFNLRSLSSANSDILDVSNRQITQQVQQALDNELAEMESVYQSFFNDSSLASFIFQKKPLTTRDHYVMTEICQHMKNYCVNKQFYTACYLFVPSSDQVFTPLYVLPMDLFYRRLFQYDDLSVTEWRDLMLQGYLSTTCINPQTQEPREDLYFLRTIYQTTDPAVSPVLLFRVPVQRVFEMISEMIEPTQMSVSVVDQNDHIIIQIGNFFEGNYQELESENTNWKYRFYLDQTILQKRYLDTKRMVLIGLAVGLLLEMIASVLLAWYNSEPVRRLFVSICEHQSGEPQTDVPSESGINEFTQIEKMLENTWARSESMQKQVAEFKPVYVNQYLYNTLRGRIADFEEASEKLSQYEVCTDGQEFQVASIVLENVGTLSYKDDIHGYELLNMMVKNVLDELFENIARLYYVNRGGRIISMILCFEQSSDPEQTLELMQKMVSFFEEKFEMKLFMVMGGTVSSFQEISVSYAQAQQVLQVSAYKRSGKVMTYAEIMDEPFAFSNYSIEDEMQLLGYIRNGDEESLHRKLQNLFESNGIGENSRISQNQYIQVHLLSSYLKFSHQLGNDSVKDPLAFKKLMIETQSGEAMMNLFLELARRVNQKNESPWQIQKVMQLVEENYSDDQLSVALLAEKVGLNPSYLSTLFKEVTGGNLLSYIQAIRIQHAQTFLAQTDLTLKEITLKCGYHSDASFLRIFRNNVGMTPGEYRRHFQSQ